jgi:hypothetical protein
MNLFSVTESAAELLPPLALNHHDEGIFADHAAIRTRTIIIQLMI